MTELSTNAFIAAGVFVVAYLLIATERLHRTVIAISGAALVLALRLIHQDVAFSMGHGGVDWNVIFLLVGMMIIVAIARRAGLFQWMAIRAAKLSGGRPLRVLFLLAGATALLSAFLDNVTTVLFMAPIALLIADALGMNPVPLLVSQILASNIGGTATLIGDPPNIMIGSAAKLGFIDFLTNLTPIIIVIFFGFVGVYILLFRGELRGAGDAAERIAGFDESRAITDRGLARKCVIVLALTFAGFFFHQALHLEPATVALSGAALLLLVSGANITEILHELEWTTLFFFIGLFVMVGALVETGVIARMAAWLIGHAQHHPGPAALGILWASALVSGVVDNIPFVATMNPMLVELAAGLARVPLGSVTPAELHSAVMMPFWWALALGACLGGNFTLVGASANVVVAGILERNDRPITFRQYLRYGIPCTFVTIVLSTVYIWLRYL